MTILAFLPTTRTLPEPTEPTDTNIRQVQDATQLIRSLLLAFDGLDEMFADDLRKECQACADAL